MSDAPETGTDTGRPGPEERLRERMVDDETIQRREQALLQIRRFGDPALKARAVEVTAFDEALEVEAARMAELMNDALGIGLAATQLGQMRRMLVFQSNPDAPVTTLVNPRVGRASEETEWGAEGCLSIPGIVVDVERPLFVEVNAIDERGSELRIEAAGLEARVLQHEIDHLDGVLMIDRAPREERREAIRAWRERTAAAD
ncbi:MAG: peptide deformylase [Solirubrobacterales bacterium]